MLRVRPLVYTADLARGTRFLTALGLTPARDREPDDSCAVFDAGSGRVAPHACTPGSEEHGTTALAFEVGDVHEFARRTAEAGTAVELTAEGHGPAARITAPDGLSFLAHAGPRDTGAPASPLAVLALWYTTDDAAAPRVLADLGAKPRIGSPAGTLHAFRAKNGGLVAAITGPAAGRGLAFDYEGDVRDLVPRVSGAGFDHDVVEESHGRSLRTAAPWGAEVVVHEARCDVENPTAP